MYPKSRLLRFWRKLLSPFTPNSAAQRNIGGPIPDFARLLAGRWTPRSGGEASLGAVVDSLDDRDAGLGTASRYALDEHAHQLPVPASIRPKQICSCSVRTAVLMSYVFSHHGGKRRHLSDDDVLCSPVASPRAGQLTQAHLRGRR